MTTMSIYDDALTGLKQLAEKQGNQTRLADAVGEHPNLLSRWFTGSRKPSWPKLANVLEKIDAKIMIPGVNDKDLIERCENDFAYIPKVKAKLGAGSSFITNGEHMEKYAFRKEFIREVGGCKNLVLMDVIGDSMEPYIMDGDTVMINTSITVPHNGDICAVRVNEELLIKKVQIMPGYILLKSINKDYSDLTLSTQGDDDVEIKGKAVWVARKL